VFRHFGSSALLLMVMAGIPAAAQDPNYALLVTDAAGLPGAQVTCLATLDNAGGDLRAWSYGVCHNASVISLVGAVSGSTTQTVNRGGPPEFESLDLFPGEGVTHAVVICFMSCGALPIGNDYELVEITYQLELALPQSSEVCFCETLGTPPVVVLVSDPEGNDIIPVTECGTVAVQNQPFRRSDCNNNGQLTIGDSVYQLEVLFGLTGLTPDCEDACDSNDDGIDDIGDVIFSLCYQFNFGPPPPEPFPRCGLDASADTLDCGSYDHCPP